jgi:hypothetical protein
LGSWADWFGENLSIVKPPGRQSRLVEIKAKKVEQRKVKQVDPATKTKKNATDGNTPKYGSDTGVNHPSMTLRLTRKSVRLSPRPGYSFTNYYTFC